MTITNKDVIQCLSEQFADCATIVHVSVRNDAQLPKHNRINVTVEDAEGNWKCHQMVLIDDRWSVELGI